MNRDRHEPDEQFLTESARRQVEQDYRDAPTDSPMGPIGEVPSRHEAGDRSAEAGLTEAAIPGQGPTADDAAPETLMPDDGARSPRSGAPSNRLPTPNWTKYRPTASAPARVSTRPSWPAASRWTASPGTATRRSRWSRSPLWNGHWRRTRRTSPDRAEIQA